MRGGGGSSGGASLGLLLPENSFSSPLSRLSVELGSLQGMADGLKYKSIWFFEGSVENGSLQKKKNYCP